MPSSTHTTDADGLKTSREAEVLFNRNVARYVEGDKVYFWGSKELLKDQSNVEEVATTSIPDSVVRGLIYDALGILLSGMRLRRAKPGQYFIGLRDSGALKAYSIGGNIFSHDAIRVSLEDLHDGGKWVSLLATQVVTGDGERYNPAFSRQHAYKILDNWQLSDFEQCYQRWVEFFGDNLKYNANDLGELKIELTSPKDVDVVTIPEPKIAFNASTDMSHYWPEAGLKQYGPLDHNLSTLNKTSIKVALVGIGDSDPMSYGYLSKISKGEGNYPGFEQLYRVSLEMRSGVDGKDRIRAISPTAIEAVNTVQEAGRLYLQALTDIKNRDANFDVAVIEIPNVLLEKFKGSEIDFRDYLKTIFISPRIATQILTESVMNRPGYTLANFSLGLYVSAGGKPWRLERHLNDTAYIGITFGIQENAGNSEILVGVAEIFDEFGDSLGVSAVGERYDARKGYHVDADSSRQLISSLLEKYKEAIGSYPERVIVHKSSFFNDDEKEIEAVFAEKGCEYSLIHLARTDMRLVSDGSNKVNRGSYFKIDDSAAVIYTDGVMYNGRTLSKWPPSPWLVKVDAGSDLIENVCSEIMGLTKLNWNSMVNHEKTPATLSHAAKVTDLLRAGLQQTSIVDDFRYYF